MDKKIITILRFFFLLFAQSTPQLDCHIIYYKLHTEIFHSVFISSHVKKKTVCKNVTIQNHLTIQVLLITLCLLALFTDDLCKLFGPRSGPTFCQA